MTTRSVITSTRSSSHRETLDDLRARLVSEPGTSQQDAFDQLTGADQLWWNCCQEALVEDPAWLSSEQAQSTREFINGFAPIGDGALADPAYVVALTLARGSAQPPEDANAIRTVTQTWHDSGLLL